MKAARAFAEQMPDWMVEDTDVTTKAQILEAQDFRILKVATYTGLSPDELSEMDGDDFHELSAAVSELVADAEGNANPSQPDTQATQPSE